MKKSMLKLTATSTMAFMLFSSVLPIKDVLATSSHVSSAKKVQKNKKDTDQVTIKAEDAVIYIGTTEKVDSGTFSATAVDSNGNKLTVNVDDSKVNYNKIGNYEVTLTSGTATKTVTLHIYQEGFVNPGKVVYTEATDYDSAVNHKTVINAVYDGGEDGLANPLKVEDAPSWYLYDNNKHQVIMDDMAHSNQPGDYGGFVSWGGSKNTAVTSALSGGLTFGHYYILQEATLDAHDVTINKGDKFNAENAFDSAVNSNNKSLAYSDLTVDDSKVDTSKPGTYDVTYSYVNELGPDNIKDRTVTKTITVTVIDPNADKKGNLAAHDSTISEGSTWNSKDNFDQAVDVDGSTVDFSNVKVAGNVDTSKPGSYQVTYSFTDQNGNVISQQVTVTVTAKPVTPPTNDEKGTINAHDSEIDKGAKFDAQDNFDSATNANGAKVDWDQIKVTGADQVDTNKPGDYQVTYSFTDSNGHLISKTVTVTVNDSDDVNNGDGNATQPNGGKPFKVYAKTSINEYSSDTFTAKGKKKHYAAKNRVYAPIFTVKKVVTNKNGRDRYLLDNGRYITANTANVNYLYWQGDSYKQLYVIHPTGTYEYKSATFAKKNRVKLHHQGEVLKVKKVIHQGLTTRYQLTNGNYVSGNKQWTSPNKWSFPKRVKAVGAINVYKTANLTGKVKHYKAKSHQVFTVKGFDYSHGFENRGYTKRYKVSGGYISANPKIVKEVK